jgi:hypothetical protein
MSVLMVLKMPIEADGMRRAAEEKGDQLREIEEASREAGAIHHAFYSGDDGVIVVDEWDSRASFEAFFEAQGEKIGQLMQAAGAQGPPDPPQFYEKLALGDEF